MKHLMIYLLLGIGLIGINVQAEEASVPEFAAIFQLSTSDQASVAAAFTTFAASDCRKEMPTAIRIMRETFNGTEDISHSIIWNFADTEALTKTFASFQCREWADVAAVLSQQAEFKSQQLVRTLATGGDYTKDSAYIVWQMAISDEAAYVDAYNDLMKSQIKNGLINGAYGLWRVQGGANSEVTHIAFAGADSLATLLSNSNPSKAFVAFQRKVAGIRTVHRQNINAVLADL